jgi:hypothetical protein
MSLMPGTLAEWVLQGSGTFAGPKTSQYALSGAQEMKSGNFELFIALYNNLFDLILMLI